MREPIYDVNVTQTPQGIYRTNVVGINCSLLGPTPNHYTDFSDLIFGLDKFIPSESKILIRSTCRGDKNSLVETLDEEEIFGIAEALTILRQDGAQIKAVPN